MKKFKLIGAIVLTGILLPTIITVFWNGHKSAVLGSSQTASLYKVQIGQTVYEITEEQYLLGALAAAMPMNYEIEALKAMVVVLRTNFQLQKENDVFIVSPEQFVEEHIRAKAWGVGTYKEYDEKGKLAIRETAGQIIKMEGRSVLCPYHQVSAGKTRNASEKYSYLKSVDSNWDRESEQYLTVVSFQEEELEELFPEVKKEQWEQIVFVTEGETPYIKEIELDQVKVEGETFRETLGLCSSAYFGVWQENGLKIICKGQGHGFGMSCYGANELAKAGKGYKEILSYYYKYE